MPSIDTITLLLSEVSDSEVFGCICGLGTRVSSWSEMLLMSANRRSTGSITGLEMELGPLTLILDLLS
jgi:hypothetical protein